MECFFLNISGKNVWNRVSNDSSGLHNYYNEHKNNWLSGKGIEAEIYTLKSLMEKNYYPLP